MFYDMTFLIDGLVEYHIIILDTWQGFLTPNINHFLETIMKEIISIILQFIFDFFTDRSCGQIYKHNLFINKSKC